MSITGQHTSAHTNGVRTLRKKVDQTTRVLALQDYVRQSTNVMGERCKSATRCGAARYEMGVMAE